MTVFLSDLKVSLEQSIPVAVETNRQHHRGTVTAISESGAYVVLEIAGGFGSSESSTIRMADIVDVRLNA